MSSDGSGQRLIAALGVWKRFAVGGGHLDVLRGVDLEVDVGEIVCVVGPSGAGKSTLLHLLGGLDRPDAGEIRIASTDLLALDDDAMAHFRNRHIGFVFQFHHLLAEFTAVENVMMPLLICGDDRRTAREAAAEAIQQVGLEDRNDHLPAELSGGESQRVALARALVTRPSVVFADEPTGNLDADRSHALHDLMIDLSREQGQAFVIVTHDLVFAERVDRVVRLNNGQIEADGG